ncbi:MAG: ABC transporter ATP-binding protein [Lachnospiraceae bacterium]|nr:ABC transporter ATP-binding protein [Lachnospiraceae bacterium]
MKKLLRYLKDYKKECVFAPLFKMLEATFELFVPLVMAAIIDTGIARSDTSYIIKMSIVLIVLGLIGLTCSITAQYFSAKAAVGFSTKVRHALFAHIESLSFSEMDKIGTSTLITRMTSDINQAQSGVNMVLRLFLRSPFIVIGAMVMAFTVDAKAAMTFVVTIPLLCIVVFGIMLLCIPLYKKVQAGLDGVLSITRENLTGMRVIRAFAKEEEELAHFNEANEGLTKLQMFVAKISALMNPVTYVIINGATVVLIYVGALRVDSGILTQGEVVALVNYMSQILVELIKLANLIITITKAIACGNRIQSVFEMKPSFGRDDFIGAEQQSSDQMAEISAEKKKEYEQKVAGDHGPYILEFDHVGLTYRDAKEESLTDINLKVKPGETIGIIGGTGSGKSSLVHMIPRFYDATKGEVLFHGVNVKELPLEVLRDKIGMVMQKAVLFQGSIADNLRWGKKDATEEEMWEALTVSQAKEFVEEKEGGLSFKISQGGKNLSGGQRQRMTIARAVVKQPEILILDDSASALDYATDLKLRKAIAGMKHKVTTFIVSQRTSSILEADQILVLDDGQICGHGTHEQLLQTCEVYQEIYASQYRKEEA